jgi:hypothetical protein
MAGALPCFVMKRLVIVSIILKMYPHVGDASNQT